MFILIQSQFVLCSLSYLNFTVTYTCRNTIDSLEKTVWCRKVRYLALIYQTGTILFPFVYGIKSDGVWCLKWIDIVYDSGALWYSPEKLLTNAEDVKSKITTNPFLLLLISCIYWYINIHKVIIEIQLTLLCLIVGQWKLKYFFCTVKCWKNQVMNPGGEPCQCRGSVFLVIKWRRHWRFQCVWQCTELAILLKWSLQSTFNKILNEYTVTCTPISIYYTQATLETPESIKYSIIFGNLKVKTLDIEEIVENKPWLGW